MILIKKSREYLKNTEMQHAILNIQPEINVLNRSKPRIPIQLKVQTPSKNKSYSIKAEEYQRYDTTREHIYNVTDTYAGSDEQVLRDERVLNVETLSFQSEEIMIPEVVERIYIEISSNAGDNVARSLRHGIDPGELRINMDRNTISVRNGGIPIPIEIHPKEQVYVPEMIFGMLHSSSNYDKTKVRTECGRNGYGAKLTNIFSKQFMVTIGDPNNKKWYRQIWYDNMTKRGEPEIKDNYEGDSFVEVVYKMDFERFGYKEYPDEAFRLFARHAADISFTGKVPVTFNGTKLNVQKAKEYAKLYLGEQLVKKSLVYYQWPPGTETIEKKGVQYAVKPGIVPMIEICVVDTPDTAINVSFCNGMWTRNGGVHADAAFKAVATGLLTTVNGGNKNMKKKKGRNFKLNLGDVKRHASMFISCWLGNPKFDSQAKRALRSPTPKISIDEKILKPIMRWDLVNRLYAELDAKHFKANAKSDGRKKKYLGDDIKGEDANKSGTVDGLNCTLYITEGKSAMGFAVKMLSLFERGRDYIGLMPLKGKPLNVMNAHPIQIAENDEIDELKGMLGLQEGMNYLDEDNFKTLRYGHLVILADADTDGKHILGLVLNLFHCKYPTLLARGYVMYLRTKIIDVKNGTQMLKFYSDHEYRKWKEITPDYETWSHNYFKGLGTSTDDDIEDEFKEPKIVQCFYDDMAPQAMQLAFHKSFADKRKEWIRNWIPDFTVEEMEMQPISSFINHEFIQFSINDVCRSIPRMMDGLKLGQRKIIWGSMDKWKTTNKTYNYKKCKKLKTVNLASYVSERTNYHHGPTSLCDTITHQVHDFVGSNNLPLFRNDAQYGTRNMLGKDAADPRYTMTRPQWFWNLVFKTDDIPLLEMVTDEGEICEPKFFLPIIPLQLVNGANGIGTGHSTFIPNHNPLDICMWVLNRLDDKPLQAVLPWYRKFTGDIKVIERKVKTKSSKIIRTKIIKSKSGPTLNVLNSPTNDENVVNETTPLERVTAEPDDDEDDVHKEINQDEVGVTKNTKYSMVTSGTFEIGSRKKVIITELPIGKSIHAYDAWLRKQRSEKKISGYNSYSKHDTVHFEITGFKGEPTLKSLHLTKSYGMSNMVLLDSNNKPIKYNSTPEILESFYNLRLPYYQLRKDNTLNSIQKEIDMLNSKIRFIIAVINGYNLAKKTPNATIEEANEQNCILAIGLSKKQIMPQMERLKFAPDLLKKVTIYHCTNEEMELYKNKVNQLINDRNVISKISIKTMWKTDINDFITAYCKEYKCEMPVAKIISLNIN